MRSHPKPLQNRLKLPRPRGLLASLLLLAQLSIAAAAGPVDVRDLYQEERDEWKSALTALRAGNTEAYNDASSELRAYPLWPFLEYEMLKRKLSTLSAQQVEQFSNANDINIVSRDLKKAYLSVLAKKARWDEYLRLSRGLALDTSDRCLKIRAQLKNGSDIDELNDSIAAIWNKGASLPDACDPLFSAWHKGGGMTTARVFERVESAIRAGNPKLAGYLGRTWLAAADRKWVDRWISMRQTPLKQLARNDWKADPTIATPLLRYGIRRAALRDYDQAESRVSEWIERYNLTEQDQAWIASKVGLAAATDFHPSAVRWLARVPDAHSNASVREWRIRAALRGGDFKRAGEFIGRLTAAEQAKSKWRYWRARVLASEGQTDEAQKIYRELAGTRNFYGFLAADIIGSDYVMNHFAIAADDEALQALTRSPELIIARELFFADETFMARRQWTHALGRLSNDDMQRAAVLADRWGWHDRAIITAGRSGYTSDLDIRFPILHREMVEKQAKRQRLDPGWVYGVVRQESAFNPEARSSVGALGLMQLMPKTGRRVGRKLELSIKSNKAILNVDNNITLGTAYLRMVLDRNLGHIALATASYNAGPHKVVRWLPEADQLPADIWIETIPYSETRNFVKNVLAYTAVYETRMGGEQRRLSQRLPAVLPPEKQTLVSQ